MHLRKYEFVYDIIAISWDMQCKIRIFLQLQIDNLSFEIMARKLMILQTQKYFINIQNIIGGGPFYPLKVFNSSSLTKNIRKTFIFFEEFYHYYDAGHYEFIRSICFHLSVYNILLLIYTSTKNWRDKRLCVRTHGLLYWPREAKRNFFFIRFSKVVKESPCN